MAPGTHTILRQVYRENVGIARETGPVPAIGPKP